MKRIKLGEDYLVFDKHLVITDLHIGLEEEFKEKGYVYPTQETSILKKIEKILKEENVEKIIILGDVKETITHTTDYERIKIRILMKKLRGMFKEVIVIKGNHDGNIERIGIEVLPYFVYERVLFSHGHKSIKKEFLVENNISKIVIGHGHPLYQIKDKGERKYYIPCWLSGFYEGVETIVVPSFSEVVTGKHYKGKWPGPIVGNLKKREIFLEDMYKVK